MHQRSDLGRFCLPGYATAVLVIPVIPIVTRLAVLLGGTGYMLDAPYILPVG